MNEAMDDVFNLNLLKLTPDRITKVENMRGMMKGVAMAMVTDCESCSERTLAQRKLEEALMWWVKAQCLHSKESK